FEKFGASGARAERGGGDAGAVEFLGERGGKGEDEGFGGEINVRERAGLKGGGGGDVHDAALFAREHRRDEEARERDEGIHVHVHHVEGLALQIAFGEGTAPAEAGVVDEDGNGGVAEGIEYFLRRGGERQIFDEDFGLDVVFRAEFVDDL